MLEQIVRGYLEAMRQYGRYRALPGDYLVLDLETTGFSPQQDFIIQIGHCLVLGGQLVDTAAVLLDWTQLPGLDPAWLAQRLQATRRHIEVTGDGQPSDRHFPFSLERLRQEGADPRAILAFYGDWLEELHCDGVPFVAHNGYHFDCRFLEEHFDRFLGPGSGICFDDHEVLDTGMIVKAAQAGLSYWTHETPRQFSRRVNSTRLKGVRWALDTFCLDYYGLAQAHNLDAAGSHDAAWDVHVTHLLFQELLRRAGVPTPTPVMATPATPATL